MVVTWVGQAAKQPETLFDATKYCWKFLIESPCQSWILPTMDENTDCSCPLTFLGYLFRWPVKLIEHFQTSIEELGHFKQLHATDEETITIFVLTLYQSSIGTLCHHCVQTWHVRFDQACGYIQECNDLYYVIVYSPIRFTHLISQGFCLCHFGRCGNIPSFDIVRFLTHPTCRDICGNVFLVSFYQKEVLSDACYYLLMPKWPRYKS